jgi:hypothetical protein
MVFLYNQVCLFGTSQLRIAGASVLRKAVKMFSTFSTEQKKGTQLYTFRVDKFSTLRASGDKPETYPRGMGITYPHSIHLCYTSPNLIPIHLIFIHQKPRFIPILSTCG